MLSREKPTKGFWLRASWGGTPLLEKNFRDGFPLGSCDSGGVPESQWRNYAPRISVVNKILHLDSGLSGYWTRVEKNPIFGRLVRVVPRVHAFVLREATPGFETLVDALACA